MRKSSNLGYVPADIRVRGDGFEFCRPDQAEWILADIRPEVVPSVYCNHERYGTCSLYTLHFLCPNLT